MILYFIFTNGKHPFKHSEGERSHKTLQNIEEGNYNLEHLDHSHLAYDLIETMLHKEPSHRPLMEQVQKYIFRLFTLRKDNDMITYFWV